MVDKKQVECLVIVSEECAELTKECMKILRFGLDESKLESLVSEMGDVHCMIKLMCKHFKVDIEDVFEASDNKYNKLKTWSNLTDG